MIRFCAAAAIVLMASVALAQAPAKPAIDIKADATWTGEVTVDSAVRVAGATLTVSPGTTVTFREGGSIFVGEKGALAAKGTKENPVRLAGGGTGRMTCYGGSLRFEFCEISAMGGRYWLDGAPGKDGVLLRDSSIRDCPGASLLVTNGPVEVARCRVENCRESFGCRGKGSVAFIDNTFLGGGFAMGVGAAGVARGNVVIRGTIAGWETDALTVEDNYVHNPQGNASYGLVRVVGKVRRNVVRGGTWTSSGLGGEISGNVFISLPREELMKLPGGFDKNCTHEHICGLVAGAVVARNIFVDGSYGAILGIGENNASGAVIRNNTFDMRSGGRGVNLDHLVKEKPKNIVVRSNVFMRSDSIFDEDGAPDITSVVDYNLWAASGAGKGGRFEKLVMAGQTPGEGDFGGHDVPPWAKRAEGLKPEDVVANPDVAFPFSDEDMIARKHAVAEVIEVYRKAYAPKPGSAAIDAGSPADATDPDVKDGKPDIGAVEFVGP